MAAQQLLSLIIQAVDKASGTIGKVGSGLKGLGGDAQRAQSGTSGLSDSIAFGMVKAQAAIALVQTGVGKLQGMIQQASTIELENLSTATGLEEMLGSFDKASEFVDRLNGSLAKSAAALPGATADYSALARTITDDVAGAFKGADGKIGDLKGFQKTLESISTSYGAMAATTGVDTGNMQNFLMKALGGTASQAELIQIDALQKNSQLRTRLEEGLKQAGVDSLKDLNIDQRIKLIEDVGKKVITPAFLAKSQNTVEGMTQSFISSIFDPMGGVFGVMKDLEPKVKGQQTAFEAFKASLNLVIGSGGLFEQLGGIFSAVTGLDADSPMEALRGGFLWVNGYLAQLNKGLEYVRSLLGYRTEILKKFGGIGGLLQSSLSNIGEKAAQFVNDMLGNLFSSVVGLLGSIDYGRVLQQIGGAVTFVVGQIGSFLANLDPRVYAAIAFGLLAGAAVMAIGTFAATLVVGFLAATVGLPGLLVVAAGLAIGALAKAVIDNWSSIQVMISDTFGNLASVFRGYIDLAIGIATGDGAKIQQGLRELFNGIAGWLTQAKDTWAVLTGGKTSGQASADDVELRSMEKLAAARNAQAKWRGQIPTAAGGFLPAINSEIRNMPANASPVIANSSEFILRPEQMSRLMQGAASVGGGSGTFAPQITIQGITDPEGVAKEVLRYLEIFFDEFKSGALA